MVYGFAGREAGAVAAAGAFAAAGFAGGLAVRPPARSSAAGKASSRERKGIFIGDLLGRFREIISQSRNRAGARS